MRPMLETFVNCYLDCEIYIISVIVFVVADFVLINVFIVGTLFCSCFLIREDPFLMTRSTFGYCLFGVGRVGWS